MANFGIAVMATLSEVWPLFTALALIVGTIAGAIAAATPFIKDDDSFRQIRDWINKPGLASRYRDLVRQGLDFASNFYGPSPHLSVQGYCACMILAYTYPVLLWLLAWTLGGTGEFGGENLLLETTPAWRRWLAIVTVAVLCALYGLLYRCLPSIQCWVADRCGPMAIAIRGRLSGILGQRFGPVGFEVAGVAIMLTAVLVGGTAFAGIVGGVVAGIANSWVAIGIGAIAGAVGGAIAGFAAGAMRGAGNTFVAGAAAITIALGAFGFAIAAADVGDASAAIAAVISLVLMLPIVNALLDHISVQASRWFLSNLVEHSGPWQWTLVALDIVADLIVAAMCLILLSLIIPVVLQTMNFSLAMFDLPTVEWVVYLELARSDPGGAGLLVTGMIATTFIPTVLHLISAGVALLLPVFAGGAISAIANKPATSSLDRLVFVTMVAGTAMMSWLLLWLIGILVWHALSIFVGPIGFWLADVAEAAGRWVGGPGAPALR